MPTAQVASMLTHRGGAGCGTLHTFLFVAGGDDRSSRLNSVEMFDPHLAKVHAYGVPSKTCLIKL